jgi:hypothetical protein
MADFTTEQLEAMGLKELQAAYAEATGKTSKAPNKKFLIKGILDAQQDDSQEPDPDQQWADHEARLRDAKAAEPDPVFGMTAEQRDTVSTANQKSLEAAQAKPDSKAAATPEAQDETGDGYVNPFEGMTPKEVIEAAKAKGRAKVEKAKAEEVAAKNGSNEAGAAEPTGGKRKRAKDAPKKESDGLAEMDATALQAIYLKEIGRATGSTNTGYLIWKIREARKGNIKVGPAKERAHKSDKPVKVIPIRIEEDALAAMDELIGVGKPYSSRMDIFRKAIAVWADMAGHTALSSLIGGKAAEDQTHSHTGL